MMQPSMTLWQAIDALTQKIPFSRNNVEDALATHLVKKDTSDNPIKNTAFQFYTGGPIRLSDGMIIRNVDLRIRNKAGHPGLLVLYLNGTCVGMSDVCAHYGDLKLTYPPRPDSTYAFTGYSAFPLWGKLSFSFLERNPDCLASLAFDPKPIETDNMAK
ncbi:hypothetical protein F3J20_05740 [Paraburkholderia sp. Cy-641]|nr:hypothetical protein [Paraburkholderia sp. Cy-641]